MIQTEISYSAILWFREFPGNSIERLRLKLYTVVENHHRMFMKDDNLCQKNILGDNYQVCVQEGRIIICGLTHISSLLCFHYLFQVYH